MSGRYLKTIALTMLLCQVPTHGAPLKAPQDGPSSGEYLLFGKSMFDYSTGGNAFLSGGVPISHPLDISFEEGGVATINGLFGSRAEYLPASGAYDSASRSITFPTPSLEISSLSEYVLLGTTEDAETLLCAVNPYGLGYLDLLQSLSFNFSEDFRSLYPSSGFASGQAYLVNQGLYQIGSYDMVIYDAVLLKKEQGVSFNYDCRQLDIPNSYPSYSVDSSFRIFNTGDERSEYVIGSSSPNFIISNPSGVLAPGEFVEIKILFSADEPGDYSSTLTITNEEEDKQIQVNAVCVPLPDYSRIVSEGTFQFSTDARYPWTISEEYASQPVAVCGNKGVEKSTSPLYADVVITEKKAGHLSWDGYCDPFHPLRDAFGVIVDGEECYVSPSGGGSTSSQLEIAPGSHRIEFLYVKGPKVDGTLATGEDYAWIGNLKLSEYDLEQNAFSISADNVAFSPRTIVKKGANDSAEIVFKNEGWDALQILGAESDSNAFSCEVNTTPFSTFATSPVTVYFHTFTPGKHSGNIVVHTNAGDAVIRCTAEAVSVPDYSPIVTSGEFDFDTSIAYPFKVENNLAYNSSSKKIDRKATSSMLQANFEVPEGYYGELSWKARVSTSGADGEDLTDYATIYINGEDVTRDYYGESVATQYDFAPASVNFYPGEHFVCFAYTQAGDAKFTGDDRIEVSDLSLELKRMNENEVRFWGTDEAVFENVWISKVYQREVKLSNFGSCNLQIKSVRYEGDFVADIDTERFYNTFEEIPIVVTFIPKKPGAQDGAVVLDTTAGEVRINCHASVVDDPTTLLIEDFEDDWRLWDFIDGDEDGMTWSNVLVPQNAFHGERALQSFSIHSDFTDAPIDDIAISPEFTVPADGAYLSFYLACYYPEAVDGLKVLAGSGNDYTAYSLVADLDLQNVAPYYNQYKCALDAFAGQTIRLAFRHALDAGVMSFIAIDDIIVKKGQDTNVKVIDSDSREVRSVEYYDLLGVRIEKPSRGIYVKRVTYTDGSESVEKIKF